MYAGVTEKEAEKLILQFGLNVIKEKRRTPFFLLFFRQFSDLMVIILILASLLAFFAGERLDAGIILFIVFLNAVIGFFQSFKAEKAVEALKKLLIPKARVVRDGQEKLIDTQLLVPGDLLILNEGDKIMADAEILESNNIQVDESILTGESVPVSKNADAHKTLFMGTQVVSGNAKAMVIKTGMRTEFGGIATLTGGTKKDRSPLQKELAHMGGFVGKITLLISFLLFLFGTFIQERPLTESLLFAVSVAVAAVPEGLPATITVALALGVQRLARKNAIIKQLSSVETLGSTTVICSDKTGTLTKNEMTVLELYMDGFQMDVHGVGYAPNGYFSVREEGRKNALEVQKKDAPLLAQTLPHFYAPFQWLIRTAVLCNNARLIQEDEQWKLLGDPTEGALLTLAEKGGFSVDQVLKQHSKLQEFPFDSFRKRMSVITREIETGKIFVYIKGAPDVLVNLCSHKLRADKILPLDDSGRKSILNNAEAMANHALRTMAFAYREVNLAPGFKVTEMEKDLIFVGLVGMVDPPREEVKEAIKMTHAAGIRVFIITGDHGLTAHAIAKSLAIVQNGANILTGDRLDTMDDAALKKYLLPGQETIFARVSPKHKLKIVDTLKQMEEVVAVTGDGVNDAPALKRADIGVAMGITGTDVSKEAANIVLLDDRFNTIISAILEGRTIYENMKKFVYFLFSSNIGELVAIFLVIPLGIPPPLTAVLILIINILTDVFPALALSLEPVEASVLHKPPRHPDARILNKAFIVRFITSGILIGVITVSVFLMNLFLHGFEWGDILNTETELYRQSVTMAFVVLTFLQMIQALNSRSENTSLFKMNFFQNPHLITAIAISVGVTVALVQLPFFSKYLQTTPLSLMQWFTLIVSTFLLLLFEEIRKMTWRRYHV